MDRTRYWHLAGFALGLVALFGGVELAKGGFYLGKHEGDAIHLIDIVLRMAAGQWPHLDFMTPIGVLATAPMALFAALGFGIGHAIILAQILVALLIIPVAVWAAMTRLEGYWRHVLVGYVMVLCLAVVHGEAQAAVSISMHYNRWAWAVSYVVLLMVILPARKGACHPSEGIVIGLAMAVLALMKMTYFVALAPVVLVALVARRLWWTLTAATLAGLGVAAVVTALAGPGFWLAYLQDLLTVAQSTVRERPGEQFTLVIGGAGFIAANLALLAVIVVLRESGRMLEGLLLFLLFIPFAYIVYQNFGNDPQWIVLAILVAVALWPGAGTRVHGVPAATAMLVAVSVLAGVGIGSVVNMLGSPFRHYAIAESQMLPLLTADGPHSDIFAKRSRMMKSRLNEAPDAKGLGLVTFAGDDAAEAPKPTLLNGEPLRDCTVDSGFTTWETTVARDLVASGDAGKAVLVADLFAPYWLFGDLAPVPGAAPWYYGGTPGLEHADLVLIPVCPKSSDVRRKFLEAAESAGWTLTEVRRTPVYILTEARAAASDGKATSDK